MAEFSFCDQDEVACGPPSKKEIQLHFQQPQVTRIRHRLSEPSTSYFTPSTTFSGESSTYYTPHESVQSCEFNTKQSKFLDDLNQVLYKERCEKDSWIEPPLAEEQENSSSEAASFWNKDQQNADVLEEDVMKELYSLPLIKITDTNRPNDENTQNVETEIEKNKKIYDDISLDNRYDEEYDGDEDISVHKSCSNSYNEADSYIEEIYSSPENLVRRLTEDSCIIISSDDDDFVQDRDIKVSTSMIAACEQNTISKKRSVSLNRESQINDELSYSCNSASSTDFESNTQNDCDKQTKKSLSFNDTLDELDKFLNCAESNDNGTVEEVASKPRVQQKTCIPKLQRNLKTPSKFQHIESRVADYINKGSTFKMPLKALKEKTPKFKPPQPKLQDIVSPLKIYINNTNSCIKQNVGANTVEHLEHSTVQKTDLMKVNIESNAAFPQVLYKPPKKTIVQKRDEIYLPPSIKKLVPEKSIKTHGAKMKKVEDSNKVKAQLFSGDLTTANFSILNQTGDMSFVSVRDANNK